VCGETNNAVDGGPSISLLIYHHYHHAQTLLGAKQSGNLLQTFLEVTKGSFKPK
jgi:hypothetical protein